MSELRPGLTAAILSTTPVYLPFERTTANLPSYEPTPEYTWNYTPYQLFVLRTRIQLRIADLLESVGYESVNVAFESVKKGQLMAQTVTVYSGAEFISLSTELSAQIQELVNSVLNNHPDSVCLLDSTHSVRRANGLSYPKSWIASMLKYIPIVSEYQPAIYNGQLLVNLGMYLGYTDVYNELYAKITEWLDMAYQNGFIVTNPSFARLWNLVPIPTRVDQRDIETDMAAFTPRLCAFEWTDREYIAISYIDTDITKFLIQMLDSSSITVKTSVQNNYTPSMSRLYRFARDIIKAGFQFCMFQDSRFQVACTSLSNAVFIVETLLQTETVLKPESVRYLPISSTTVLDLVGVQTESPFLRDGYIIDPETIVMPTDDRTRPYLVIRNRNGYRDDNFSLSVDEIRAETTKLIPSGKTK